MAGGVARRIRGTHICWVLANDVADGHFVLHHLVITLRISDHGQVLVRPGVAGHLMAIGYHALDDIGPRSGRIDGAFPKVVACNKEGGLEAVRSELVEDLVGVEVWARLESVCCFL